MYPMTVCCTSELCQEIQKYIRGSYSDTEWVNIVTCIYLVPCISDAFDRYVDYKCNSNTPSSIPHFV